MFAHLRKGGRAALLDDHAALLAGEAQRTSDLAAAMDHTLKTAQLDYSNASTTVTAGQQSIYRSLQKRFVEKAELGEKLPKFMSFLADYLSKLLAIMTKPKNATTRVRAPVTRAAGAAMGATEIGFGDDNPDPISSDLAIGHVHGQLELGATHTITAAPDRVPVATHAIATRTVAGTTTTAAATSTSGTTIVTAAAANSTSSRGRASTNIDIGIIITTRAIGILLETRAHELKPSVLQNAVLKLINGSPLGLGGVGTGDRDEDVANCEATRAKDLAMTAHMHAEAGDHDIDAPIIITPTIITARSLAPEKDQAISRPVDVAATAAAFGIGVQNRTLQADLEPAAPVLRIPPGSVLAMMPRSHGNMPAPHAATGLINFARARNDPNQWHVRLKWLGRLTPSLVPLDAFVCDKHDPTTGRPLLPEVALQWIDTAVSRENNRILAEWWLAERTTRANTAPPEDLLQFQIMMDGGGTSTDDENVAGDDPKIGSEHCTHPLGQPTASPPSAEFRQITWNELMR